MLIVRYNNELVGWMVLGLGLGWSLFLVFLDMGRTNVVIVLGRKEAAMSVRLLRLFGSFAIVWTLQPDFVRFTAIPLRNDGTDIHLPSMYSRSLFIGRPAYLNPGVRKFSPSSSTSYRLLFPTEARVVTAYPAEV